MEELVYKSQRHRITASSAQGDSKVSSLDVIAHTTMFHLFLAGLVSVCTVAGTASKSSSLPVGGGSGTSFSSLPDRVEKKITGVRIWEHVDSYIYGIQLKYDDHWSTVMGYVNDLTHEMLLYEGEVIKQVSGKYHQGNYIYQVTFGTSIGRFMTVGQPYQISFNLYPVAQTGELIRLTGRYDGNGITSLEAHWADLRQGPHAV